LDLPGRRLRGRLPAQRARRLSGAGHRHARAARLACAAPLGTEALDQRV
jgi:hypothetical protein